MSLEGRQIGRYRISQLLGSGNMGDVYLADDAQIERQIAIKVIRAEVNAYHDENAIREAARLFEREARAIARLDHPHILPLYDYGEEHIGKMSISYLVMPYRLEGSLPDWLGQRAKKGLLSPQDLAHIVSQAADALQHAHDHQVIHQDVKPSNFLVRARQEAPTRPDLFLSDFGIARLPSATSNLSMAVRGTPSYMAPEQWEGVALAATDQYALAVMAYELLTGRLPFQGGPAQMMYQHMHVQPEPPSALNQLLSADIDAVLLRALAKQPEKRFASIKAFAKAFQQAVDGMQGTQAQYRTPDAEIPEKAVPPIEAVGIDSAAPTLPVTDMQMVGSDSITYVKPIDTSGALAANASVSQTGSSVPPVETKNVASTPRIPVEVSRRTVKRRPIPIVALVIILLVVVVGGIAYGLVFLKPASSPNPTTGAGSTSRPPSTPTLGSTQTTTPSPQATSTLALTPQQQMYDTYISKTPTLSDPTLNNQNNQWAVSGGDRSCGFTNGAYHATANQGDFYSVCEALGVALAPDFAYQVDVTIIQGDAGGLAFRSSVAGANGYVYTYCITASCGRKQYGLFVLNHTATCLGACKYPNCQTDQCPYPNYESFINANPGATNTLTVIVLSSTINMYINGRFVGKVTDDHISSSGVIGVAAYDAVSPTDVTFSNAKVWILQ